MDWGLGHATRCVPVIRECIKQGFFVFLAGEKAVAALLKEEFPELQILPLKGYRVRYGKGRRSFFGKILLQTPKILQCIREEKKWVEEMIAVHRIDIVISDNRFGLYSKNAHCIFITHQLFIKTGNSFTEKIAQKINYRYIDRFDECWVPDNAGNENLAGELSHPKKSPKVPVKYIGILSRFIKMEKEKQYDIVAVISGPEPQRSIFEKDLIQQLRKLNLNSVLVRGLPGNNSDSASEIKIIDHLPASALNELLASSHTIITRSGYSTLMDLVAMGRSAVLVPTPGQTEQEYLAEYLSEKDLFISVNQEDLDVEGLMEKAESFPYAKFPKTTEGLSAAVKSLL